MNARLAVLLSAPLVCTVALLGCPKKAPPADAGPAAASVSAPSSAPVLAPEAAPPEASAVVEDLVDEAGPLDAAADGDATDGDADAKPRPDANEDAPLFGTKTFMDETPMKGFRKITASAAKVRKAPKDGEIIATLPKGTEVTLAAEIFNWYRVRFTDPVTSQRRQGWIYITTVAGPRMKTCPPGWTWHPEDNGWCDKECTKNTDCKALKGYKCSGTLCFYAAD